MNRFCEKEQVFHSNSRIFEGCFAEVAKERSTVGTMLRTARRTFKKALASARVQRIAKVAAFTGCLVGMLGIIGAMEAGSLALGTGLILGIALLGLEYLCLRNH